MSAFWTTVRLIVAEKLLHLAMVIAPRNIQEGQALVVAVHNYCADQLAKTEKK